jgi:hypothetical protein
MWMLGHRCRQGRMTPYAIDYRVLYVKKQASLVLSYRNRSLMSQIIG